MAVKRIPYSGYSALIIPFSSSFFSSSSPFSSSPQLVGVEELGSNVGDKMKMCEDALERLKAELASTKEHKTRISVDVSLEGIRIMEEKSRKLLYFHQVHQLVFIAFDVKVLRGC